MGLGVYANDVHIWALLSHCRRLSQPHIPSCQYMGLGVYANDFHIWAHLSHCRRLSQAPYPHANIWAWVYMQMISIFGHSCRTVAGFLRPHTLIPIHGPGCICKWFPYLGTPVALSQALSGPIYPHPNTWAWVYVYANDFHIWALLSHCRRLSQAPYPHANTWAWVYMQMISIYGHSCRTVAGFLRPHTLMPIHGPGCICK